MSAWVVKDRVIQAIVTYISQEHLSNPYTPIKDPVKRYEIDLTSELWENKLATALLQMNHDSVAFRYDGEHEDVKLTYHPKEVDKVQLVKYIHCYLYQCCEGKYPETPLYKFIEEVGRILADTIVTSSPEYDKAAWG